MFFFILGFFVGFLGVFLGETVKVFCSESVTIVILKVGT